MPRTKLTKVGRESMISLRLTSYVIATSRPAFKLASFMIFSMLFCGGSAFARQSRINQVELEPVKQAGLFQSPVVFVGKKIKLEGANRVGSIVSARMIVRLGTEVFQSGRAMYECRDHRSACRFVEFQPQRAYSKCTVRSDRVICTDKLRFREDGSYARENDVRWYDESDFPSRRSGGELNEFSERVFDPENPVP